MSGRAQIMRSTVPVIFVCCEMASDLSFPVGAFFPLYVWVAEQTAAHGTHRLFFRASRPSDLFTTHYRSKTT